MISVSNSRSFARFFASSGARSLCAEAPAEEGLPQFARISARGGYPEKLRSNLAGKKKKSYGISAKEAALHNGTSKSSRSSEDADTAGGR